MQKAAAAVIVKTKPAMWSLAADFSLNNVVDR